MIRKSTLENRCISNCRSTSLRGGTTKQSQNICTLDCFLLRSSQFAMTTHNINDNLKYTLENLLLRIANTILLNSGMIQNIGLLDGKAGAALFLYHYSQINKNQVYSDFAEKLLDEVSDTISRNATSVNFVTGLTGIAWAVRHLIEEKYVDADSEDILEEVDALLRCINQSDILSDLNNESPFFSKGIYFAGKNEKEVTGKLLNELNRALHQNIRVLPLSYLISILYVILQENDNTVIPGGLPDIVYARMTDSIKNKNYTFPDVLLLTEIIEQMKQKQYVNFESDNREMALETLDYNNLDGVFNMGLYRLIFNKIRIEDSMRLSRKSQSSLRELRGTKQPKQSIENLIDSMIKDVYRNLNLYNGLAGAGLTLIDYFQKRNETV